MVALILHISLPTVFMSASSGTEFEFGMLWLANTIKVMGNHSVNIKIMAEPVLGHITTEPAVHEAKLGHWIQDLKEIPAGSEQ